MIQHFEILMEMKRMEDFEAEAYGCDRCAVSIQKLDENNITEIRNGLKQNGQQPQHQRVLDFSDGCNFDNGGIFTDSSTVPFNPFGRTKSLPFGPRRRQSKRTQ